MSAPNPFDTLAESGTFGACSCSSLSYDGPCPNEATIVSPEGWLLCQEHAELIDTAAKIMDGR